MEYKGYRLKIDGVVFPNHYMKKGTWKALPETRLLVNSFYDSIGTLHEDYHTNKKADIAFSIKQHNISDHEVLAAFFNNKENVQIEFWNDNTSSYQSAVCKIEDFYWQHENATQDDIFYKEAKVSIVEY